MYISVVCQATTEPSDEDKRQCYNTYIYIYSFFFVHKSTQSESGHKNVNTEWRFICRSAYWKIKSIKCWHVVNETQK